MTSHDQFSPRRFSFRAFTLVELMAAVGVIAVGFVFVLGAFSQCAMSMTTAQRTITAYQLLEQKLWNLTEQAREDAGAQEGEWFGDFEAPNEFFSWRQTVRPVATELLQGNLSEAVHESWLEEEVSVHWTQGRRPRTISVTRFVPRQKLEEDLSTP